MELPFCLTSLMNLWSHLRLLVIATVILYIPVLNHSTNVSFDLSAHPRSYRNNNTFKWHFALEPRCHQRCYR